ncbi:prepilin peptidase [Arthrobacter sp. UYCo732]|uniref:prepilin peptidase n=1 Tax=Arthrobacter sp. UYCo732 TaxID=3156336 RepID=UPI0033969EE0
MSTVLTDTAPIDIQASVTCPDEPATEVAASRRTEATTAETAEAYTEPAAESGEPSTAAHQKVEEDKSGFNDSGLRELTSQDWLFAATWGIAGALATTAVSVLFVPVHLMALTFVLGAGLGMLGYLDYCTQLIRNAHNIVFGTFAAILLIATLIISPASAILLPAVIAAAASFVFMLVLAMYTGFAGGGDIKISPIPAALLAAISPITAMMWLLFTFTLCLAAMISARLTGSKRKHVAMAPFMAVAAVMAIAIYGLLAQVLGI